MRTSRKERPKLHKTLKIPSSKKINYIIGKKNVNLLGSCYHQDCSLLLSHNEWFYIKLEKTKEGAGAVRWQMGEAALLCCVVTACG